MQYDVMKEPLTYLPTHKVCCNVSYLLRWCSWQFIQQLIINRLSNIKYFY